MLVSDLILFPDRFKNCRFYKLTSLNISRLLTWFFEALIQIRFLKPATIEISAIALVLRSRYLIYWYLKITGNSLYIYFSAIDRRLYAIVRLLAVFPSPESDPFRTYYNFFKSYYALILASYSAFFLYYSFNLSSSNLAFYYSSSCSLVFYGGTYWGSSDIFEVVLFNNYIKITKDNIKIYECLWQIMKKIWKKQSFS